MSPGLRNVLEAVGIAVIGFVLFNVAFMMLAGILSLIMLIANTSIQNNMLGFVIFFLVLVILSVLVFRTKLNIVFKAGYLCMPVMSVLVMIGVIFHQNQWLVFGIAALFVGGLLSYLRLMKLPWQYLFSVLYCTAMGIIIVTFNIQI